MAVEKKTLYIEADDELAHVIDQVLQVKEKIVAIVLPKRASVFQSIVNVKLLKKAAEEAKKQVVLISSDPNVSTIAGVAGVYLASSLTSKPLIPKRTVKKQPDTVVLPDELIVAGEESLPTNEEPNPVDPDEPIEIDNTLTDDVELEIPASEKAEKPKKKFKIPDFGSFKLKMSLGIGAAVLLIVLWIVGFVIMPKATITINADTSNVTTTLPFIAKTSAKTVDKTTGVLPAVKVEISKEDKATVPTTGKKDAGEKATGIVTLTNCLQGSDGMTIPSGTSFSKGSNTYVTTESVDLGPAVVIGSKCVSADYPEYGAVKDAGVVATKAGESYNQSAGSLQSSVSGVTAYGSDITGGTTNIVAIVTAEDIQKAKDQLKGAASADALKELSKQLSDQQKQALNETLTSSDPTVKSSHQVDAEVAEVTVTQTVMYSLLGIDTADLATLLDSQIEKQLEGKDKNIRDNGLEKAVYRLVTKASADDQTLELQTIAVLGAEFDTEAISKEVAGKKRGDIERMLESRDGVRSVGVEYSPFWVMSTPSNPEKIQVVVNEVQN